MITKFFSMNKNESYEIISRNMKVITQYVSVFMHKFTTMFIKVKTNCNTMTNTVTELAVLLKKTQLVDAFTLFPLECVCAVVSFAGH